MMKKILSILSLFSLSAEAMGPSGNGKYPYGGYGSPYSTGNKTYGNLYRPGAIRPDIARKVTPPKENQEKMDLERALQESLKVSQPISSENILMKLLAEQENLRKDLEETQIQFTLCQTKKKEKENPNENNKAKKKGKRV